MCDYKIIKELGRGMFGTTYLVEDKKKNKYAMKLQKILKKDIDNKKSQFAKELGFIKKIVKYPDQFITLHCYEIIPKCDFQHKLPEVFHFPNKKAEERWKTMQKSQYCVKMVYDLLDAELGDMNMKMESKKLYSLLAQLSYIVYLFEKLGYIHNDLHFGNIMYKAVQKNTTIKIFNQQVPTYGYLYKAIDYGDIKKLDEPRYRYNDMDMIISQLGDRQMSNSPIGEIYRNNQQDKMTPWNEVVKKIKNEPEYNNIKPYLVDNYGETNATIIIYMFYILNEIRLCELLNIPKILPEYKKYIGKKWFVPQEDMMYVLRNIKNVKKIVKYFINKL